MSKGDFSHNSPVQQVLLTRKIVFIGKAFVMTIIVLIQDSCRWAFYAFMLNCFQIKMLGKLFAENTKQQEAELFLRNRYPNPVLKPHGKVQ